MSKKPYVVVGGGPVGLMLASYLATVRRHEVVVVEQQAQLGGLYSGMQTPWGLIDQGVHIPQETGNPDVDALFFEAMPEEHWHMLTGARRDIAGNVFAGRLDVDSIYPDLRQLPRDDYLRCLAGLMNSASVSHQGFGEARNLKAFLDDRFGAYCTERVFDIIVRKIWRLPADQLSPWAAKIVHLMRVVTHDRETSAALKVSPALDGVIGFPQQLYAPEAVLQSRRSFYPKKFGLECFVSALTSHLVSARTRLLTSATIAGFEGNRLDTIQINHLKSGKSERLEAAGVVWASPLPALAKLLGASGTPLPDAPLPHRVLHLFLDRVPETGPLYWLWSYDGEDDFVRVSIPEAYCPDAVRQGVHPICVEMHAPAYDVVDEDMLKMAETQLRMTGLIAPATHVLGGVVHGSNRTYFVPTIGNIDAMITSRKAVETRMPDKLVLATQDLSAGIFFLPDILSAGINMLNKQYQ